MLVKATRILLTLTCLMLASLSQALLYIEFEEKFPCSSRDIPPYQVSTINMLQWPTSPHNDLWHPISIQVETVHIYRLVLGLEIGRKREEREGGGRGRERESEKKEQGKEKTEERVIHAHTCAVVAQSTSLQCVHSIKELICALPTCTYTWPPVQSRVAAGFSQFSKNILKPFLTYNVACVLCLGAPQRETQLHTHCYENIE